MPDIKHMIQMDTAPQVVYPLVSTANGFSKWWATDVTEIKSTGDVELGFFNRTSVYRLHPTNLSAPGQAHWICQTGKEWNGTRLLFDLEEQKGRTRLRFAHADWKALTDYEISCNTTWGELMFRLKATAEGKSPGPLFSASGMGY